MIGLNIKRKKGKILYFTIVMLYEIIPRFNGSNRSSMLGLCEQNITDDTECDIMYVQILDNFNFDFNFNSKCSHM